MSDVFEPRLFIAPSIPKGIEGFRTTLATALVSAAVPKDISHSIMNSVEETRDLCRPLFSNGGAVSTSAIVFITNIEELGLSEVFRERVERERVLNLKRMDMREEDVSNELILNLLNRINLSFFSKGLDKYISPNFLTNQVGSNGMRRGDIKFGSFKISLPNEQTATYHSTQPPLFGTVIATLFDRKLLEIDRNIYQAITEFGLSKSGAANKFTAAMLYDICVENDSLDPSKIVN